MSKMEYTVRELLRRYYQGDTSLEEEDLIRDYFCCNKSIPIDLMVEKEIFCPELSNSSELQFDLEAGILDAIDKAQSRQSSLRGRTVKLATVWAAAASVVILLGLAWFLSNRTTETMMVDTYDDPYVALQETQRVLALVGSKINRVQNEMRSLDKLNLPTQILEPVSDFSRNIQQLEKLKAIEKPKEMPFIKHIFTANSSKQNVDN